MEGRAVKVVTIMVGALSAQLEQQYGRYTPFFATHISMTRWKMKVVKAAGNIVVAVLLLTPTYVPATWHV